MQQQERVKHESPDGVSFGVDEANACVWVATVFGPSETIWDGGMFQVEFVFPPDFPEAPPYVHFLTGMFHPHISVLGVPYLRSLIVRTTAFCNGVVLHINPFPLFLSEVLPL